MYALQIHRDWGYGWWTLACPHEEPTLFFHMQPQPSQWVQRLLGHQQSQGRKTLGWHTVRTNIWDWLSPQGAFESQWRGSTQGPHPAQWFQVREGTTAAPGPSWRVVSILSSWVGVSRKLSERKVQEQHPPFWRELKRSWSSNLPGDAGRAVSDATWARWRDAF